MAECTCTRCNSIYVCNLYDAKKSRIGDLCDPCKDKLLNLQNFSQTDLLEFFNYDKNSGELTHKIDTRRGKQGEIATRSHTDSYQVVNIGGKPYLAHRVIWLMMTGSWPKQIDHIDHDRSNNRWSNLRNVKSLDNQKNMGLKRNNSSGCNGVRVLPSGRYYAYIMINRKQKGLGTFDTLHEAESARKQADKVYGFHDNHGN